MFAGTASPALNIFLRPPLAEPNANIAEEPRWNAPMPAKRPIFLIATSALGPAARIGIGFAQLTRDRHIFAEPLGCKQAPLPCAWHAATVAPYNSAPPFHTAGCEVFMIFQI